MSASVCVFCGQIKQGVVTPCSACARMPTSETDLAYSFALSTHYQTAEVMKQVSAAMQRGAERPELPPEQEDFMRQVAREWMSGPIYQAVSRRNERPLRPRKTDDVRQSPRALFSKIVIGYIAIGGLLATILWASYLWPLTWGSSHYFPQSSFYERTIIIWKVQPIAVVYSVVRAFFWGPSLLNWAVDDSHNYSFGKWLAPGFYAEEWKIKGRDEL